MRHVVSRSVVSVLALLSLAGCISTPRPFEHNGADDQAFKPRDVKIDVAVGPPKNMPPELGRRVAAALAVELQSYGIVATLLPADAPAQVSGVMSTRDAPSGLGIDIDIDWSVTNAKGTQGPIASTTEVRPEDYAEASDRLVSRIAQRAAPQVATLMGHPPDYEARSLGQVAAGLSVPPTPPAANPAASVAAATAPPAAPPLPQVKVLVAPVSGAPSDGNQQLFSGMRRALGSSRIVVIDKPGADTYTVAGAVSLTPIDDRSAQLSLTWVLKDAAGKEVGKVEQSNPVPLAATRGSWAGFGDIVAAAAGDGILDLLDKALQKPH